jgi:hypothetical protein
MCMCLKVLMKTKRNKISKLMNLIFGGVPERLKGPSLELIKKRDLSHYSSHEEIATKCDHK